LLIQENFFGFVGVLWWIVTFPALWRKALRGFEKI